MTFHADEKYSAMWLCILPGWRWHVPARFHTSYMTNYEMENTGVYVTQVMSNVACKDVYLEAEHFAELAEQG